MNHPIDRGDDGEPAQCDMGDEDVESVKGRRKELRYGIEREIPRGVRGIETRRVRAHVASKDGGETPARQERGSRQQSRADPHEGPRSNSQTNSADGARAHGGRTDGARATGSRAHSSRAGGARADDTRT